MWNWIKSLFKPPEIIEYKPTERDTEFKQYIEMLGGSPFAANLQIPYPSDELNENFKNLREKIESTDFDQDRKVILSRENYDILKDYEYCQFQVITALKYEDESFKALYTTINCLGNVTEESEIGNQI